MATDGHGSLLPDQLLSQMTFEKQQEGAHRESFDRLLPSIDEPRPTSPIRQRPWSSQGIKSTLSPSPALLDDRKSSKDDSDISTHPITPKRADFGSRTLSLQMPPRDFSSTSTANLSKRVPVSPKPDSASAYPSPTSVLPRRSRGLDFSRAATNLHHSTLAEQPSPECSPSVGGRRGLNIPGRKGFCSPPEAASVPDSPRNMPGSLWSNFQSADRAGLSSSLGSSAIMDNDSGSSSSDEMMDLGEDDDTIHMNPNNGLSLVNPFGVATPSASGDCIGAYTPAPQHLLSYQRARLKSRRSRVRGSSSSASGQSNMQSPIPPSPPLLRSIETNLGVGGNYLLDEPARKEIDSRRQSLSLGTNEMRLSDAEQSGDEGQGLFNGGEEGSIPTIVNPSLEERKQVVRRAPKSKGFARIKAALQEEGAPIDVDLRREAEVIRQVRENDADSDTNNIHPSQPTTSASSPSLGPVTAGPSDHIEGLPGDLSTSSEDSGRRNSSSAFSAQAARQSSYWNNYDERMRTPPPPHVPRANSSGISDDVNMEASQTASSMQIHQNGIHKTVSHESISSGTQAFHTTTFEIPKKGNKRMRDDDLDPICFKRRAVSPSMSVQNSPVLPQSPGWWGTPKRDDRLNVTGSAGSNASTGKRVGIQGMNDTNDGLMNMVLE
ncbi:uncharacterized protein KY384_002576 [Bacidia gigantensis]|uniref:uncharacterized protein n=1 Tax=Bacidia gigantensis TaxID=2732470 RepID=UPI001D036BFB|nr:uncharacterized protein KY384_002576 [Bacidia gigantensis]KAG8532699.1 hypothetical protein KY384_002576 [Bacidia gigantensis]